MHSVQRVGPFYFDLYYNGKYGLSTFKQWEQNNINCAARENAFNDQVLARAALRLKELWNLVMDKMKVMLFYILLTYSMQCFNKM